MKEIENSNGKVSWDCRLYISRYFTTWPKEESESLSNCEIPFVIEFTSFNFSHFGPLGGLSRYGVIREQHIEASSEVELVQHDDIHYSLVGKRVADDVPDFLHTRHQFRFINVIQFGDLETLGISPSFAIEFVLVFVLFLNVFVCWEEGIQAALPTGAIEDPLVCICWWNAFLLVQASDNGVEIFVF